MKDRFPKTIFFILFGGLLLMSGLHTGLILLIERMPVHDGIKTAIPLLYWACVSLFLTSIVRSQIHNSYEVPMQNLARAAEKVASGDFSVYVPAVHTPDKTDYLDDMIHDFNKMTEELGSIETLKTDFISNVSHEMKTPIAVIRNDAQIIQNGNLSRETLQEYAGNIIVTTDKMTQLITNILKLNKLENQTIVPDIKSYDLSEQLCECIFRYDSRLEEKQIDLEVQMEDRMMIDADPELLSIVWNNLLSNAIKFTDMNGSIWIEQKNPENEVQIIIRDNGCGMSEETIKHIFDKFYQGDTSHAAEGNGLGLALSMRVLQLMNGSMEVTSTPGEGSSFLVTLPRTNVQR
ncbi:MAG: HAMP domain-containing sensor histidine kinase [Eubacteriales bacterium]|nr:HAMP domain-containing sensor histidine kinase [Eubacteriales bacterium]